MIPPNASSFFFDPSKSCVDSRPAPNGVDCPTMDLICFLCKRSPHRRSMDTHCQARKHFYKRHVSLTMLSNEKYGLNEMLVSSATLRRHQQLYFHDLNPRQQIGCSRVLNIWLITYSEIRRFCCTL